MSVDATVNADSTIHVVENRTVNFSGDYHRLYWNFNTYNSTSGISSSYVINSVSIDGTAIPLVPFQSAWADDSSWPSNTCYSIDATGKKDTYSVYVYSPSFNTKRTVTIDYTLSGSVTRWADCGELYWQFIGGSWGAKTDTVSAKITLPMPAGQTVSVGDQLRAWGHGPLSGVVTPNSDGTVTYSVENLAKNTFVEARIVFPGSWLSQTAPSTTSSLDKILSEESANAQKANAKRAKARTKLIMPWIIGLVIIVICVVLLLLFGKEHKAGFKEKYYRETPRPDLPIAVIGRLMRDNKELPDNLTATLMSLSQRGYLTLGKAGNSYTLTRDRERCATLTEPLETQAVKLFFETCGNGADTASFDQFSQYAKSSSLIFRQAYKEWQKTLNGKMKELGFFEKTGGILKKAMNGSAGILFFVALLGALDANLSYVFAYSITAIVLLIIARKMNRFSREAVELHAQCDALKNWFADFTILDERLPTDVAVWGQYLIYAFAFGVAAKVMASLRVAMPGVYDDPTFRHHYYYWYAPATAGAVSPADAFSSTVSTAVSASSSSSGAGGGFSGGGGGGGAS